MSTSFGVLMLLWIPLLNGYTSCPDSQTTDTHLVCLIFMDTTIESINLLLNNDFSDNNYCNWGYNRTLIGCNSPTDININWIEIEEMGLVGTLNLGYPWPKNVIQLDLEQPGLCTSFYKIQLCTGSAYRYKLYMYSLFR